MIIFWIFTLFVGASAFAFALIALQLGIWMALLYAAGAVALALTGPGRFSLDALLGISSLWTPAIALIALTVGIIGGFGNVAIRRPQHANHS